MSTKTPRPTTEIPGGAGEDSGPGSGSERQLTGPILFLALVSAISGLLYGYDTGIISGALLQISDEFGIGNGWEQVIAASILLGAVIGALVCSRLSSRYGRHPTMIIVASVFIAGSLAAALSPTPTLLALSRVLLGFAVGGATQTAPMYVAETAPSKLRGRLVLAFQIAIGAGIVIATLIGATESIDWRISIGSASALSLVMLLLILRLPESPRWLVKQDREDRAREVLQKVRHEGSDIDAELEAMRDLARQEKDATTRGWAGLKAPWVRPAVVIGVGIVIFTQLSGIEMIIYYSPTILTDNGFGRGAALDVSVGLGVTYLVMQLIGMAIIDRVGRRRLALIMIPGAFLSLAALGSVFVFGGGGAEDNALIITCLIVFMAFNAGGLQLLGWLTGSEVYPLGVREAGTAATSAALWSTNLLITLTLLSMITAIGVGPSMWVYAAFNVAAWVFVYTRLPDLTGKSLEQIEGRLREGRFTPKTF